MRVQQARHALSASNPDISSVNHGALRETCAPLHHVLVMSRLFVHIVVHVRRSLDLRQATDSDQAVESTALTTESVTAGSVTATACRTRL